MHSTSNLEDKYLGSGRRLGYSINKYGKENHIREIIEFLPDRRTLSLREKEIVNENLLKDPLCINIQPGGGESGSNYRREHTEEVKKSISEKLKGKSYEEIHSIETANLERDKRKRGVQKYWDNVSDVEKNERILKLKENVHRGPRLNPEKLNQCPHCGIFTRGSSLKRWHYEKCKEFQK
jgi:hypothetical protein